MTSTGSIHRARRTAARPRAFHTRFALRRYYVIGRCVHGSYQVWYAELAPTDRAERSTRFRELAVEAIDTDAHLVVDNVRARSEQGATKRARRVHEACAK
ncbi:hypothetical protein [Streptomyces chartreusis]|uniref:Uncharacterized protein n=1 Tax=Streptomyces chartreusis TaxID=1969 RepID=A0A7H8TLA1_STRCX|nr:hypothetical protein [Streptomyces chartreusis]QKZ23848.1 hypothetical protein HUT05_44725 [Streptomyces chartreusis]